MFTKSLKTFLIVLSFLFFSYGGEIKNSDVRIEIISRIKIYKEKVEKLKEMYRISSDKNEKELIKRHIKLLEKKIKNLEKVIKEYEKISPPAG